MKGVDTETAKTYDRLGSLLRWIAWGAAVLFITFPGQHISNSSELARYSLAAAGFLYLVLSEIVLSRAGAGSYHQRKFSIDVFTDLVGSGAFVWATGGHESPLLIFYLVFLARAAFRFHDKLVIFEAGLISSGLLISLAAEFRYFEHVREQPALHILHVAIVLAGFWSIVLLTLSISKVLNKHISDSHRLLHQKEKEVSKIVALHRVSRIINSSLELDKIYLGLISELKKVLSFDRLSISILDESGENIEAFAATDTGTILEKKVTKPTDVCCTSWLIENKKPLLRTDLPRQAHFSTDTQILEEGMNTCFSIPLTSRDTVRGALCLYHEEKNGFSEKDLEILEPVADHLSMVVENVALYERIKERAIRDSLTGVYNHGYLLSFLGREFTRAKRYQKPLSIVMLDVDGLKKYNDTYGHQDGDKVLKRFAQILMKNLRGIDIAARYGGDEFMLVLPETDLESAKSAVKRLEQDFRKAKLPHKDDYSAQLSFSAGIASYPSAVKTKGELIRAADQMLYRTKEEHKKTQYSASK